MNNLVFVIASIRPEWEEAEKWFSARIDFGTIASHQADQCGVQVIADRGDEIELVPRPLSCDPERVDDRDLEIL